MQILDLRSAIEALREWKGQLVETDIEVDPEAEVSGVYRHVGAGGTVMRPTKIDGPAMIFNNVKGHPDAKVLIGLLASRERTAMLLGCKKEELGKLLCEAALHPIEPVVSTAKAPCQEIVHRAEDKDFDLFQLIPAPTNTPVDAGPYITMGMCYATHPDTGLSDVTIHRMCIQSRDELSIFLQPGSRHIGAWQSGLQNWDSRFPSQFQSAWILQLRLAHALNLRQHRLDTMSFQSRERSERRR